MAGDRPESRHHPLQRKRDGFTDIVVATHVTSAHLSCASLTLRMNTELQITEILGRGDPAAVDALIPKIYDMLRHLARRQRVGESAHTLDTTALVHEAYMKLADQSGMKFADRAHLYAYMSRVMRHILIDHARRKNAQKRQAPEMSVGVVKSEIIDVLAIDEALGRLAALDPRLAQVAELRLFADLSSPDIAMVIGVTARTVERDWLKARTFLSACLLPPE